jgi:nickel transport protein
MHRKRVGVDGTHSCREEGGRQHLCEAPVAGKWYLTPFCRALLGVLVWSSIGSASPAAAHHLTVFASVHGRQIDGEVYFQGGDPAGNAAVAVVGPDGQALGQTQTDQEGKFSFQPRYRCDHTLIVDAGMGHGTQTQVSSDELPLDLPAAPAAGDGDPVTQTTRAAPDVSDHQHAEMSGHSGLTSHDGEHLAAELQALTQQITALRRDLERVQSRTRLQDLLGGIGYILGIMGLAFYFLGVRRKERRTAGDR